MLWYAFSIENVVYLQTEETGSSRALEDLGMISRRSGIPENADVVVSEDESRELGERIRPFVDSPRDGSLSAIWFCH